MNSRKETKNIMKQKNSENSEKTSANSAVKIKGFINHRENGEKSTEKHREKPVELCY